MDQIKIFRQQKSQSIHARSQKLEKEYDICNTTFINLTDRMYRENDFDTYGTKTALYSFSRQMTHPLLSSAPTYVSLVVT